MSEGARPAGSTPGRPATYPPSLPRDWWLRNPRYFLVMLRDFSPVPIALWLVWLLAHIARLRAGAAGYHPSASPAFVILSVVCLGFALLHSVTWLQLSGVILRVRLGERTLSPRAVITVNFAMWAAATLVIGFLLIWLGR